MVDRDAIKAIEAAQAELGDEAFLWAQPSQGDVRLFRGELTAGDDGAYPERSWKLDPETMAAAEDEILFDEIM